ncbi:ornithine cyclodeaminase family protein [Leptobacterium flavescens]|uniref:Ornithine cyclodeaminase family protein n=1 Tax=Leptobacterium flavescens TaxID=472055 RepID=A0A6P0UJR4_9FLAO|nr:ornithine cyclodeaminase family protein [Leptobacterium flavescens]NER12792.1 ornithine cyclodeaminase family protein [Leptobacterium flavescens]
MNIPYIDTNFIENNTDFGKLVNDLKRAFVNPDLIVPMRHHHDFPNPEENKDSTLLLMPAWNPGREAGVKIVTVSPNNGKFDLPSIQGTYIYLDAHKGGIKAILEAKALTAKRTAAASALASSFLSRKNASSLLMIGTGALSANLIKAHASVRPIKNVFVWGRNPEKSLAICDAFSGDDLTVQSVRDIEEVISEVDIISCATLSQDPLVFGKFLKQGQHIDLVGAYKKNMREADDETIRKSSIFLDTYQGGLKESGDIVIPLEKGIIDRSHIKADLFELCSEVKSGRTYDSEITLFKSVGHALEDLAAATYYYEQFKSEQKQLTQIS